MPEFYGHPGAKEAKNISLNYKKDTNPVLRGVTLVVIAWLISTFGFLQKLLWVNAGFNRLRKLRDLSGHCELFMPTVIPVSREASFPISAYTKAEDFKSLPSDLPGQYRSIKDYHELYLAGKLTPLAVAESLLPLIRRDVTRVSYHSIAFTDSNVELLLQAARASTQRYKEGRPLGILDGIPAGIKDECDVAGYRTHNGRKRDDKLFEIKSQSDWPVQKWEEAGVIVMGKLTMHEMGADTTNNNPHWGTPRNPHNPEYYTGGSSGGSAYVVSAGIVPIALGFDGGGSIRIPSSFCGVYGLKPSHSRVGEAASSVTVIGPLAASISDLEVAYRVMASPIPNHPVSSLFKQSEPAPGNRPKIIGIFELQFERADPDVKKTCYQVVQYFRESLGYEVVNVELPYLYEGQGAHAFTILAEMIAAAKTRFVSSRHWLTDLTAANKLLFSVGSQTPAEDYVLSSKLRHLLMSHLAFLFQKHPGIVIVTPTTPIAGWPIKQEIDLKYGVSDTNLSLRSMEYIWMANFTGCPAISCPVGYVSPTNGKGDLPVGIQAMGEWGSEDALIEWGRDAEKWLHEMYPNGRRHPTLWEDVIENAKTTVPLGVQLEA